MNDGISRARFWQVVGAAAALLAVAMGSRSALGLFLGPIAGSASLGMATVSLAIAAGLLAFGVAQPAWGLWERRVGAPRVIVLGAVGTGASLALLALGGGTALMATAMIAGGATAAALGAPLLMGMVAQRVPPRRHGLAMGVVSAGSSAGQLVYSLAGAAMIAVAGWQAALLVFAASLLAAAPLARAFRDGPAGPAAPVGHRAAVPEALRHPSYWYVTAGFFVCGFHVSFLTTHMPGVIDLCGLPPTFSGLWLAIVGACNIGGSLAAGALMQRVPMRTLLGLVYAMRALGVAAFIALPPGRTTLIGFALWMGLTYMATLPLTTGLLTRLYGARSLAVLFGITMAAHQAGSFLGAWLGGVEFELTGGYRWTWVADILLAVVAALLHLPVRESAAATPRAFGTATTPVPAR
jgi:predicted MFS family arabinose efflux permease